MWLPGSASGKKHLAANTTYKVMAESGGDTKLSVRTPQTRWPSAPKREMRLTITSSMDQSRAMSLLSTGNSQAPLAAAAVGIWLLAMPGTLLEPAADSRYGCRISQRKVPVDVLVQDWRYWGKYGWNAMRFDESDYPDPAAMMSDLHRQNFHMVISVWRSSEPRQT